MPSNLFVHKASFLLSPFFQSIKKNFLDTIFPKRCIGCGTFDTFLCNQCFAKIPDRSIQGCPFCRNINEKGEVCRECRSEKKYLHQVLVSASYHHPLVKKSIRYLKYHSLEDLSDILSRLLVKNFGRFNVKSNKVILIPVPMHERKVRQRGYNQSELLAQALFKKMRKTNIHYIPDLLIKRKNTRSQTDLSRPKRIENVRGVFICNKKYKKGINKKRIIIVDDLITSSATLNECAKVLKSHGAKRVDGLVLARN